ncbi:DoxX family protein [Cellulomonas sp. McL0617]|uniref:DoxX family protein n=1 Tax=Cellulomonas sp. McL0617 TaxID=3415675 RepID=UPI003CF51F08
MTVAYWIIAGLLALLYLWSGGMKIARSRAQLQPMMHWVDDMPMPAVRAIGVAEVLGAIGLIVPPLTGIAPALALAAAIGLLILQLAATTFHLRRGEKENIGLNIGLVVVTGVLVWLATIWL